MAKKEYKVYRKKKNAQKARRKGETTVKCKGGWRNKRYDK